MEMGDVDDTYMEESSAIEDTDVLLTGDMGEERSRRQAEFDEQTTATTEAAATTTLPTNTTGADGKKCTIMAQCEDDDDCNGGKCLGFSAGRCNCNACITSFPCKNDEGCGGLQGACNTTMSRCDCLAAYAKHGYNTPMDRMKNLCNVKTCKMNECNGLRCNKGFCTSCPVKKN